MRLYQNQIHAAFCIALMALAPASGRTASAIQGWGRVSMQGEIVDTACAIAAGSREQTIDMGTVPLAQIRRDGQGNRKPFSIELVNCVLERQGNAPDWKFFQVTFDGQADGGLFGVQGEAGGVALRISDARGNVVIPGVPLQAESLAPGDYSLNYAMTLMANQQPLKAGSYSSAVRFKLDYF